MLPNNVKEHPLQHRLVQPAGQPIIVAVQLRMIVVRCLIRKAGMTWQEKNRIVPGSHPAGLLGMWFGWGASHLKHTSCERVFRSGSRQRPDSDQLLVQAEVDFNAALVQERQEQFRHIEREVTMVGDIFKDLSLLVNEQGIQIGTWPHGGVGISCAASAGSLNGV
jgi:hypothetical protein